MLAMSLKLPYSATLSGSLLPFSLRCEPVFSCYSTILPTKKLHLNKHVRSKFPTISCCWESDTSTLSSSEATVESTEPLTSTAEAETSDARKRRRRFRKHYPGEKQGITEEMRFVAMRLHNSNDKINSQNSDKENNEVDDSDQENIDDDEAKENNGVVDSDQESSDDDEAKENNGVVDSDQESSDDAEAKENNGVVDSDKESSDDNEANSEETWEPSVKGFLKYLVDSKLVFETIERIVDESRDVSYAYFRKTGLERSKCISKDIEWFRQQDFDIPKPSHPGIAYVKYLEGIAEKSPPSFLSHFYNIYFSHIAGGQVIARKVSERLFEGKEMELYTWDGDEAELLRGVREKLNMIGQPWSRDEKNRCLREAAKAFRYLGQIVRLIIVI